MKGLQGIRPFAGYSERELPLGSYALLVAGYGAAASGALLWLRRGGRRPPERIPLGDMAVLGAATFKLSRLVAKDWVTAPLRAPFARYKAPAPGGEVEEEPRGTGLRRAVGDLVTCPFCMGPWVATGLMFAYAARPAETRLFAAAYACVAASNFLQRAYGWAGSKSAQAQAEARTKASTRDEGADRQQEEQRPPSDRLDPFAAALEHQPL